MSEPKKSTFTRRALIAGTTVAGAGAVAATVGIALADDSTGGAVDQDSIDTATSEIESELVELRARIHRYAEPAGQEHRTAALVAGRLRDAGLSVTTDVGGTGVVAVLEGAEPGRTVAYRADMDAVPPEAQINGGDAPAHLCGHDLHTTIGVGIAEVLAGLRDRLTGTIVFVFQPGEESLTGARAMLEAGVLDKTGPEEIHALHCGPFPSGQFAVMPGYGLPGVDQGIVTVTGPGAKDRAEQLAAGIGELATTAFPQTAADMEQMVTDIQTQDGPLAESVVTMVTVADGATDRHAELQVAVKCWPQERHPDIREQIGALVEQDDNADVDFPGDPFPAMVVPVPDGLALRDHLHGVVEPDELTQLYAAAPYFGEDFALFLQRFPGTFTFLGVGRPGSDITTHFPHNGAFDPDESAIAAGVRAMAGWLAVRAGGES